ncbi:MAG TPA: hypothetical protein VFP34_04345 [Microlunatus sp.]|jgi:hypothetical protein|nr:hypothetical protein [Microlunatus sp.]
MTAIATAAVFVWLGMVLAISFLEAPLKFRAPGVDLPIGLAIGRLVFRALNTAEMILATIVLGCLLAAAAADAVTAALVGTAILLVQVVVVRPYLTRRSDRIMAGAAVPRSNSHHVYVALEAGKLLALATTGTLLLITA